MPRPNRDRVTVTAYISRGDRDHLDKIASEHGATRSDVIRLALAYGLPDAKLQLALDRKP